MARLQPGQDRNVAPPPPTGFELVGGDEKQTTSTPTPTPAPFVPGQSRVGADGQVEIDIQGGKPPPDDPPEGFFADEPGGEPALHVNIHDDGTGPPMADPDKLLGDESGKVFVRDGQFFAKTKGGEQPIPMDKYGNPAVTWNEDHWEGIVGREDDGSYSYGPQEDGHALPSDYRDLVRSLNKGDGIAPPRQDGPPVGAGEAAFDGFKSSALMGTDDEISGFGGAAGNWLARNTEINRILRPLTGYELSEGSGDWNTDFERERGGRDARKDQAWREQPLAYGAGYVGGFVPSLALPGGRVAQLESRTGRVLGGAGVGSVYGGISGAANAEPGHRVEGAEWGAGEGALGGAILPPVLNGAGRLAYAVGDKTGINTLVGRGWNGLEQLVGRGVNPAQLGERVAERRALGFEDTPLVDVLDRPQLATVRAAASRNTPGRDRAVEFAQTRRANVQDETARVGENLSPTSEPVAQTVERIETGRGALADNQYEQFRNVEVPVTDELRSVLDTGAGRKALQAAMETSDSPAEVAAFLGALRKGNEPSELDRLLGLLPEGINPEARAQVRAQLEKQGVKGGDPMPPVTVDMMDRVKRALQARQRSPDASGQSRQLGRMIDVVTEHADDAAPGYADARANFAGQSRLAEAADVGERSLNGNPDEAIAAVNAQSADPTLIPAPGPVQPGGNMPVGPGPSPRQITQQAARRTWENRAGQGPRAALELADQGANGTNMLGRLSALTDDATAGRMQGQSRAVRDRYERSQYVNPDSGSQTQTRGADAADAALGNLATLAVDYKTGGVSALVRGVTKHFSGIGMSNRDAEHLVSVALDPARTDEAIRYLTTRVGRTEANRVVRALIGIQSGARISGEFQDTDDHTSFQPQRSRYIDVPQQ